MSVLNPATVSFLWHFLRRAAAVLFVLAILWGIYIVMVKPHIFPTPTESQKAKEIVNENYYLEPKQTFFGCSNYKISLLDKKPIKDDNKK